MKPPPWEQKPKKKGMSIVALGSIFCFIGAAIMGSQVEGSGKYGFLFFFVGFIVATIARLKAD